MAALNVTLAARMVAETELSTILEIAKKHGVHHQTVRNHLTREAEGLKAPAGTRDADFAAACRKERDALQAEKERRRHEWADLSVSSLRSLLEALEEAGRVSKNAFTGGTIEKGRIRELAGAVKIVGELNLGKLIIGGRPTAARAPGAPEEASGSVRSPGPERAH